MKTCIVAATGPSLTQEIADQCRDQWVIAVNDAYKLFPFARTLYAADVEWWRVHKGCPDFAGERLTCSIQGNSDQRRRSRTCKEFGLTTVLGKRGCGFAVGTDHIHFGSNSAFQAVNVALQRGAGLVILVGLDMHGSHFFGKHPKQLRQGGHFDKFIGRFSEASKLLDKNIRIINATPGSSLACFPIMTIAEALRESRRVGSQDID